MTETKQAPAVIAALGETYGLTPAAAWNTIVRTIFPSGRTPTQEQVYSFAIVARQYNLNPFTKEIYAFPGKGGTIIPIVSVDGWFKKMNEHPAFDGVETELLYEGDKLVGCTAKIYRKDRKVPTVVQELVSECNTGSPAWKKTPARMIRHRAITQCARVAFSFAGIYDPDEGLAIQQATGMSPAIDKLNEEHRQEQEIDYAGEDLPPREVEVISNDSDPARAGEDPA